MKRILALSALMLGALTVCAQNVTLTGTLQSSNGLPAKNYVIQFTPTQFGFIAGTGVLVNTTTTCATSTDGTVVRIGNPLVATGVTAAFTGSLAAGVYYVKYEWTVGGAETLPSPETVVDLSGTGRHSLLVAVPPGGAPSGATSMSVFISASAGTETLQGSTAAGSTYTQSVPLVSGASPATTNTTVCTQVANDVIWPVGTGYKVSLTTTDGNSVPGYPMQWQLLGAGSTINLSNGLPYYHGVVTFPTPILASPLNHALQSISGDLNMQGYALRNAGSLGINTTTPGWGVDNEAGATNSLGGYLVNGSGGSSGQCLGSNGASWGVPINCLTTAANPNVPTLSFTAPAAGSLVTGSNDGAGEIVLSNGGSGGNSTVFTLNFSGTYTTPVYCLINANLDPDFYVFTTGITTGFTVNDNGASATPIIVYICHQ